MPATDLPAYPSEDAVLSGVTADMLKLLFPAAVEEITLKAAEQRNAALLVGPGRAQRHRRRARPGQGGGRRVHRPRGRRRHAQRGRHPGAVGRLRRLRRGAGARSPGPASTRRPGRRCCPFFGQVRPWAMTPTDITVERPGAAALHVVRADAAGAGGGEERTRTTPPASRSPSPTSGRTAPAPTRRPATGTTSRPSTSATPTGARCARRAPSPC